MTSPVSPFNPGIVNRVEIVPFTYRDGATYLEILKEMSRYLVGISTTFTDVLNETIESNNLIDEKVAEFTEFVETQTQLLNVKIAEIDDMIANNQAYIDAKVVELTGIVNDAVAGVNARVTVLETSFTEMGVDIAELSEAVSTLSANLPAIIAGEIALTGSASNNNVMSVVKAQIADNKIATDGAIDLSVARVIAASTTSPTSSAILDLVGDSVGGTPATQNEVNFNVDVNKYVTPRTVNGFIDFLKANEVKHDAFIDYPVSIDVNTLNASVGNRLTIPTPDSPTGGQSTHPSVVYSPNKFGGYHYWMGYTPYAGGNDALEDPCIAVSNDGVNWLVPAGLTNPLDDAPGGTLFNSDTALVFGDNGYLYCFWRQVNNTASTETIYYRRTKDGITWEPKVISRSAPFASNRLVSPSFTYENGVWRMFAVNIAPASRPVVVLTATGKPEAWSAPVTCTVAPKAGRDNWHLEVKKFGGQHIAILADCDTGTNGVNGDIYIMKSVDGIVWERSNTPLVSKVQAGEHGAIYRTTFVPENIGGVLALRIFYGAWKTGSPTVWNIYRTIAIPPAPGTFEQKGTIPTVLIAAGTGVNHRVTFPVPFDHVPFVEWFFDSSRLTAAVVELSATTFVLNLANWTSAQASPGTLTWRAR